MTGSVGWLKGAFRAELTARGSACVVSVRRTRGPHAREMAAARPTGPTVKAEVNDALAEGKRRATADRSRVPPGLLAL